MKKLLYCAAALATMFFAGSCQRENFEPAGKGGAVTFTVTAPGELDTRATTIANGEKVNEVHWAVYKTNEAPNALNGTDGPLAQGIVPMQNKKASVELDLLQDQDYTILFWAQVKDAGHYNVGDLRSVSVASTTISANDETRDAFFQRYDFNTETAQNYDVTLVRPFAQINLGTTLASLTPVQQGQLENGGYTINVQKSTMTVKGLATSFSLVDGNPFGQAADEKVEFTFTCPDDKETNTPAKDGEDLIVNGTEYHYVAMNYLLVPIEEQLVEVSYTITTDKGVISNKLINVPVKENYRTNIIGNLLTSKTDFEIVVDERFNEPDINTDYIWGGETKAITPVQENGVNVYYVNDASELAWVAEQVNTPSKALGKTFEGEIVRLNDDINLEGNYWIPIGNGDHSNRYNYLFAGTFDGNGKTIRNMKVEYPHCAGLIGRTCGAVVKDLTIDGFDLDAEHYAGAIIGWAEQGSKPVIVENCTVLNGNIKVSVVELENGKHDLGDKAGAIVGYSHHGTYTGNAVENVSITGYRDLGGIAGYGNNSVVTGNTVSEVTLYQDLECDYKKTEEGEATPTTLGDYIGRIGGTCTIEGNTGAVETSTSYFVTDEDAFLAAAKDKNAVVNVPENTTFDLPTNIAEGVTIIGSEGSAMNFANKISSGLNNVTFKNLIIKEDNGNYNGIQHSDYITYEDCVIEGVLWVYSPNTTFTNCTFKTEGDVYAVWLYGGGKSVFTDCNFETGLNKAILVYNESSLVYDVTVDGCSFKASECAKNKAAVQMHTEKGISGNLLINNSTTENFYDQTGRGTLWSEVNNSTDPETPTANFSVTVDGVQVARAGYTQLAAYPNVWVKDNNYYVFDKDGLTDLNAYFVKNWCGNDTWNHEYHIGADIDATGFTWNSVWVNVGNNGNNGLVLNGNNHTISNMTINGSMFTGTPNGGDAGTTPGYVKNITIDNAVVTGDHWTAVFWGNSYGELVYDNVIVKNTKVTGACNTAVFLGGTVIEGGSVDYITFKDCQVIKCQVIANGKEGQDPTGASGFCSRAYGKTSLKFEGNNSIDDATTITNNNGLVGGKVYGYTTWVDGVGFAATGACEEFENWYGIEPGVAVAKTLADVETALENDEVESVKVVKTVNIEAGEVTIDLNEKDVVGIMHKNDGAVLKNTATLNISNGTIASTAANGGSAIQNAGTMKVEDAVLAGAPNANGSWPSYTVNNTGTMTIKDTEITSVHGAIASYGDGAVLILENCTLDMTGIKGFTSHGIYTYNDGKVIVKSGTYTNNATDQASTGGSVINGNVEVLGGTFVGRIEAYYGTPVLKGGTFSVEPNKKYIASGFKAIKNGDGTWSVVAE